GPVISKKQFDMIKGYIDIGKEEGTLKIGGKTDDSKGYFNQPTIIADLDPKARIMQEEIFGPVVAFAKAKDFDELLEIANNTVYGLTGSVITNTPENWIKAQKKFHVGNLYLNSRCTTAVMGNHPFGGIKLSGTDQKTRRPDYMINIIKQKVGSEMI